MIVMVIVDDDCFIGASTDANDDERSTCSSGYAATRERIKNNAIALGRLTFHHDVGSEDGGRSGCMCMRAAGGCSGVRGVTDVNIGGTALDGQTDSVKKNRIRLSVVNPSAVAASERHSTARQIQSKRTKFVCPSSNRPLSAASERRLTARQISKKGQNSSVHRQPEVVRNGGKKRYHKAKSKHSLLHLHLHCHFMHVACFNEE
jgi:hypothetical protein